LVSGRGRLAFDSWLAPPGEPYVLLFCVFLIGAGFAFHSPAWSAIVPDVVTNEELPSAATLGGLQLNVSGIIGPALGGILLHLQPCSLGLLFTSIGAGSIFGAVFVLPVVRKRLSSNASTTLANLLVAVAYLLMAFVRQPLIFMTVAALAGMGWTLGASELWVADQRAIPGWARGRMSAIVIMVSQGAISLGGVVWGFSSQAAGVNIVLVVAGITLVPSLPLAARLSINFTTSLSFDPPPISCVMSPLVYNPQPRDGPVAITFEFEVDQLRGREFLRLMRDLRLIHLRNGAFDWRLDEDLTRSTTYRIEMMVPSWTGYLLQRQRLTKAEQEIIKKVWRLHVGEQIPLERYYLCVNRELEAQANASSTPTIPLDLDAQQLPGTS
jgi:hypothetical protein